MGDGIELEVAGQFVIKAKAGNAKGRIDHRFGKSSRGVGLEVQRAVNADASALQVSNVGEIKRFALNIQLNCLAGQVVSSCAVNFAAIQSQRQIVELNLSALQDEIGTERVDAAAIERSAAKL